MRERIIEIAKYINHTQLACKGCGCVSDIEDVDIREKLQSNNKTIWQAWCPECGRFIQAMSDRKVDRIFWGGEMTEIASLDTGLLIWMIKKEKYSANTRRFIRKALEARVDVFNVPDITNTATEEKALATEQNKAKKLSEYIEKKAILNLEIITFSHTWSYDKTQGCLRKMQFYSDAIEKLS
jgi:hypothetical protein